MSECRGKFEIFKIINIEFPNGANIMNVQIYKIYVSLASALVRNFEYLKISIFFKLWFWFKGILLYKIMFKRLQKLIILTPIELNWAKFYIKHSIVWQKWEVESKNWRIYLYETGSSGDDLDLKYHVFMISWHPLVSVNCIFLGFWNSFCKGISIW